MDDNAAASGSSTNFCHLCNTRFESQKDLLEHVGIRHPNAKYKCKKCQQEMGFHSMDTHKCRKRVHQSDDNSSDESDSDSEPFNTVTETNRQEAFKNRLVSMQFKYIGYFQRYICIRILINLSLLGPCDMLKALELYRDKIKNKVEWYLRKFGALKFYFSIRAQFQNMNLDPDDGESNEPFPITFSSNNSRLLNSSEFDLVYQRMSQQIFHKYDEYLIYGSSMNLVSIDNIQLNIHR